MCAGGSDLDYIEFLKSVCRDVHSCLTPCFVKKLGNGLFALRLENQLLSFEGPFDHILTSLKEYAYRAVFETYQAVRHDCNLVGEPPNFLNYLLFKIHLQKHTDLGSRVHFLIKKVLQTSLVEASNPIRIMIYRKITSEGLYFPLILYLISVLILIFANCRLNFPNFQFSALTQLSKPAPLSVKRKRMEREEEEGMWQVVSPPLPATTTTPNNITLRFKRVTPPGR